MSAKTFKAAETLVEPLTRREREVLALLAQGYSASEIARQLTLAVSSVKWYVQQVYGKLGVNNKQRAILRAEELGLLETQTGVAHVHSSPRHNLPSQLTSFIGREKEIEKVKHLIAPPSGSRFLTLTGAGGSGKTRLAVQVADATRNAFPDGVWFIDFAPLTDPALVPQNLLTTLGLSEQAGRSIFTIVSDFLQPRRALLILDNCEHLIEACAQLVTAILQAAPEMQVLATSREPLGISGERIYRVLPLASPDPRTLSSLQRLATFPAVELFLERAQLVRPEFELTASNAAGVARVCHHLDGIPLAIELAAARLRVLTLDEVARRLEDHGPLLVGSSKTTLARQRTMAATLDWSFHLLTAEERVLLRRLAVFAGGCTLVAAEVVGSGADVAREDVLDLLTGLVDKSLVVPELANDEARYCLLETIRQYGAERLRESGDLAQAQRTHATHYLTWLATADPKWSSTRGLGWVRRLDVEFENVRAAMRWSLEEGETSLMLAAGLTLTRYGIWRGYLRELQQWWELALERCAGGDPALWPTTAFLLAIVLFLQGDDQRVFPLLDEGLARFRAQGNKWGIAHTLLQLGSAAPLRGDPQAAVPLLREAEALFRELGQQEDVAWTLWCLGNTAQLQGDYGSAEAFYTEELATVRDFRDPSTIAQAIAMEGLEGNALTSLGSVALLQGDLDRAEACLREAGALCARVESADLLACCVLHLAAVALSRGDAERGARLLGAAEGLWGTVYSAIVPIYRATHARLCRDLSRRLTARAFGSLRAEGQQMSLQEVTGYALKQQPTNVNDEDPLKVLTRRERDVFHLAANGLTNREIGQTLVLTEGTARVHVEHILAKLDLHSRARLAAWAAEHGVLGGSG